MQQYSPISSRLFNGSVNCQHISFHGDIHGPGQTARGKSQWLRPCVISIPQFVPIYDPIPTLTDTPAACNSNKSTFFF